MSSNNLTYSEKLRLSQLASDANNIGPLVRAIKDGGLDATHPATGTTLRTELTRRAGEALAAVYSLIEIGVINSQHLQESMKDHKEYIRSLTRNERV